MDVGGKKLDKCEDAKDQVVVFCYHAPVFYQVKLRTPGETTEDQYTTCSRVWHSCTCIYTHAHATCILMWLRLLKELDVKRQDFDGIYKNLLEFQIGACSVGPPSQ